MKQIECLLNPIKDEEARMEIILQQHKADVVIKQNQVEQSLETTDNRQALQNLQTGDDKKQINQILSKIDVENEVKRREIEQQKAMINKQLENCNNDDERQRLLKQLEIFETNL